MEKALKAIRIIKAKLFRKKHVTVIINGPINMAGNSKEKTLQQLQFIAEI